MRQLIWCAALAAATLADAAPAAERTVRVRGEGRTSAAPDVATIRTGVVTQRADARKALSANSEAMKKILGVLKERGVKEKDVQTTGFSVRPVHRRGGGAPPEIEGYRVSNQVRVRVRDLDKLGDVLDALVEAGSNQLSGVSFGIQDRAKPLAEARRLAVADARRRAELYAREAGAGLGKVWTIIEQPVNSRPFRQLAVRDAASAKAGVPVARGELEVRASVEVVFALTDGKE